ncbi:MULTISPECIES: TIGR00730 family Rossman fold protein [Pseudovibrio]|uniref:LOG family protein n=1 Tax=Stappiaceae TaxID=2821832 RepID=UPI0023668AE0|nr:MULTISPECIES: TIGR00730 family Rossman fold protein [Pseudovibrio]MDD7908960.1 TIGR00730 family Rossman fold protein [Pseudovibrio exalbescens]MDX5593719.1 TIGR00730 family Rossman fold protein [Pseudovibrio sp. SPO723]
MSELNTICVYCGSGEGTNPAYAKAAEALGRLLAENNIRLVYGGGSIGLMGIVARSVLEHGGSVTGVIPEFLKNREVMLTEAHDLIVTQDMHERKRIMFEKADAFIALPGGIGTLEELVEMLTWAQLGQHQKPVLLANIDGFWEPLKTLLQHMQQEKFIREEMEVRYEVTDDMENAIPLLRASIQKPVLHKDKAVGTIADY